MKINCQNEKCGYVINIPDNKVPSKPVRIACPKCKGPNIIKPPASAGGASPHDLESKIMRAVEERLASFRREISHIPQAAVPERGGAAADVYNPKKALICDDDKMVRQVIRDSVEGLGYTSDEASSIDKAIEVLNKPEIEYSLILIDKVFPEDPEGGYKILSKVALLPLEIRRKIFVIFISGDMKSGDASAAFLMGANTVVNKKDLNRLAAIIEEEMAEYKRLYRVFNECQHLSKTYRH